MAKSTESTSVFNTKSAKERSDYVKDNQDKVVMLSGMNFHMLFQIYKAACPKDSRYAEIVKRYTKRKK